jgi:hypothetical protein
LKKIYRQKRIKEGQNKPENKHSDQKTVPKNPKTPKPQIIILFLIFSLPKIIRKMNIDNEAYK